MFNIIGWSLAGMLAVLAAHEVIRYRRVRADAAEVPYPPARLRRRLVTSGIFVAAIFLALYAPVQASPWFRLAWIIGVMLIVVVGFWLLLRDLSETSRAVVAHARRFENNPEELKEFLRTAAKPTETPDEP